MVLCLWQFMKTLKVYNLQINENNSIIYLERNANFYSPYLMTLIHIYYIILVINL